MTCSVVNGDSLVELAKLEGSSLDGIVTDPPYELGFMNKAWDSTGIANNVDLWRECLRVLKPGGHLLAFGGTRTYHRMTCAIEDAGFEIRDCIQWIYGTGFPKSHDVSKAIDADAGAVREVIGRNPNHRTPDTDRHERWNNAVLNPNITAPATPAARQWAGFGTALKPACEPIVLARRPLIGTVAANVLAHGTGGINVDGCRINPGEVIPGGGKSARGLYGDSVAPENAAPHTLGRWPANIIFDEEAAALLDTQSGELTGAHGRSSTAYSHDANGWGNLHERTEAIGASTGGASRFFYVAKASRAERDYGCEHLPASTAGEATDREDGTDGLNSPRAGAGRTGGARNRHPTVKPITLMRYLCRMIIPPGGTVLDPFCGSGTTGIAALAEGFSFIGIELDPEYVTLAKARIAAYSPEDLWSHVDVAPVAPRPAIRVVVKRKAHKVDPSQLSLLFQECA